MHTSSIKFEIVDFKMQKFKATVTILFDHTPHIYLILLLTKIPAYQLIALKKNNSPQHLVDLLIESVEFLLW